MQMKYIKSRQNFPKQHKNNSKIKKTKQQNPQDNKGKQSKLKKYLKNFLYFFIFAILIFAIIFSFWVAWISRELPKTDGLINRKFIESTKIYDRTGQTILYEIHGAEKRTAIEISELPDYVPNAFIAIEDKDFYKHKGILWRRFVKAVYDDSMYLIKKYLIPKTIRKKLGIKLNKIQGASTITQQFIKNAVLSPEKKISRKVKEMILAWRLEKRFTKKQILKMYLNEIAYGSVNYGIESAAQSYFGKPAKELTLAEAAVLAALINSPSRLSPYGPHKDELMERQKLVLRLMLEQKLITKEQYNKAIKQKIKFKNPNLGSIIAPHFVMYVKNLLEQEFGPEQGKKILQEGGLRVYTTLDLNIQKFAEQAIKQNLKRIKQKRANNAALVAINPKNGEILAMVGSIDYFDTENDGNFNAALGKRQPGSSIKPLVYAVAFEKGYYPETVLYDVLTDFDLSNRKYIPKNYDLKEHGLISLRKALAGSLNIPAVKLLYLVGIKDVLKYAKNLGYTTFDQPNRYGLSFVLGGAEVRLLEHTNAFGAFANDGVFNPTRAILRIEDRYGNVIKNFVEDKSKRVFDVNSVRMLNSVLSDNDARAYMFGRNNYLYIPNYTVAAKTGTTNDYRDAWTIGYTPSIVAGVWVGNNNNKPMRYGAGGSSTAAPIWNYFMKQALKYIGKKENFPAYPPNSSDNPALNGSLEQGIKVKIDKISGKLATEYTPEELIEEKTFFNPHSILYYVDRENPFGPPPENPEKDPQFNNWENAIRAWIERYNKKAEEQGKEKLIINPPPTEYDDIHIPENIPNLEIISPTFNETITTNQIYFKVNAYARRNLQFAEFYIDDNLITKLFYQPFEYTYEFYNLKNGEHNVKIKVCDDVLNCKQENIKIIININTLPAPIEFLNINQENKIAENQFPIFIPINIKDKNLIQKINIFYTNPQGQTFFLDELKDFSNGINYLIWQKPINFQKGIYTIFAYFIDNENQEQKTNELKLIIE